MLIPVILCGGSGSRLWPVSQPHFPKPFIKLPSGSSLLSQAIIRAAALSSGTEIIIITNISYEVLIQNELRALPAEIANLITVIYEPSSVNTAAAVCAGLCYINRKYKDAVHMLILSADHLIETIDQFKITINKALAAKHHEGIIFGVLPTFPSTDFGYAAVKESNEEIKEVVKFTEKPTLAVAEDYLKAANKYYWNSGIFLFQSDFLTKAFQNYSPLHFTHTKESLPTDLGTAIMLNDSFKQNPTISFDYAIIEKLTNMKLMVAEFSWHDLGSLQNYYALMGAALLLKNKQKNNHHLSSCQNINIDLGVAPKNLVLIGLEGVTIIEREGTLIIAKTENLNEVATIYKSQIMGD